MLLTIHKGRDTWVKRRVTSVLLRDKSSGKWEQPLSRIWNCFFQRYCSASTKPTSYMNNPAWKAAVYLQHHWHCCKFSSSWSGIEKCQRTKSRRRHVRNLYSTNFALILPLLQIYNLYMPVKPFLINTQAYTAPQGLPQVKWRFPFAQPLQVRCGATKQGEYGLQARAT